MYIEWYFNRKRIILVDEMREKQKLRLIMSLKKRTNEKGQANEKLKDI